jgi:hypothetical protein
VSEAFKEFAVVIETVDGTLHPYKPEVFRLAARCSSTLLLTECIKRYNTRMAREGIKEHARLMPRHK